MELRSVTKDENNKFDLIDEESDEMFCYNFIEWLRVIVLVFNYLFFIVHVEKNNYMIETGRV